MLQQITGYLNSMAEAIRRIRNSKNGVENFFYDVIIVVGSAVMAGLLVGVFAILANLPFLLGFYPALIVATVLVWRLVFIDK